MQPAENPPPRYNNFQLWVQRNGCKLDPRLAIAADASGSMGLKTLQELPPHTAVMAVPEKLILTVQKCYTSSELAKLYEANDDLFDYEDSDDAEFNVLAVFVMYEKSKILIGKKEHPQQEFYSFWQPYLDSIDQPETAMDWRPEELEGMPQDFLEEVEHFRKEIQRMQLQVVGYLLKRPQFKGISREELNGLFNYGYKFIMTRCFGYSTPGTSLIPLADLMNHSCEAVDHQLINTKRQLSKEVTKQYSKHSDRVNIGHLLNIQQLDTAVTDYSPVAQYIAEYSDLSKEEAEKLNRCQRRDKILEINLTKRPASVDSLHLNYFSSSDEQDNDTESEEEQSREQEIEFLRQQEKEQMQVFQQNYRRIRVLQYHEVQERLHEIEEKEQAMKDAQNKMYEEYKKKSEVHTQSTTTPIVEVNQPSESGVKSEEVQENKPQVKQLNITEKPRSQQHQQTRQDHFVELSHIHKAMIEQLQQSNKFKQFHDLKFTEDQTAEKSSSSEEEQDQEFTWFEEPNTYFIISTGRPVKKDQQLYNCYGRRTNKFLLIWYGFCYPNNLFDSVSFRFHVDFALQRKVDKLVFDHYYGGKGLIKGFPKENGTINSNEVSREFRLKRSRLCQGLLIFLRLFLMNQYKGNDLNKLFATLPSSLEFEMFVLSFMEKLVQELSKRYSSEHLNEWETSSNYRIRFKSTFFKEEAKIIEANLRMIYQARSMLLELMNNPSLTVQEMLEGHKRDPHLIRKLRKYLASIQDNLKYIRVELPLLQASEA